MADLSSSTQTSTTRADRPAAVATFGAPADRRPRYRWRVILWEQWRTLVVGIAVGVGLAAFAVWSWQASRQVAAQAQAGQHQPAPTAVEATAAALAVVRALGEPDPAALPRAWALAKTQDRTVRITMAKAADPWLGREERAAGAREMEAAVQTHNTLARAYNRRAKEVGPLYLRGVRIPELGVAGLPESLPELTVDLRRAEILSLWPDGQQEVRHVEPRSEP